MFRPSPSTDRQQHIPQNIRQAMDQHMQTMPAHLQREMNSGHVSSRSQKAISDHMQKNMPSHLKQYAGAYMEQQVVNPGSTVAPTASSSRAPAPIPDRKRLDHSNVSAAQYSANFHSELFQPDSQPEQQPEQQPLQPGQTQQPPGTPPAGPGDPDYGFIMQPPEPPKRGLNMPDFIRNGSLPIRIAMAAGTLLILIIVFAIGRSIFSGGGNTESLTNVAREQQAMIHILENGPGEENQQQATLSASHQDFVATAKVSLDSAQWQLIEYMGVNGKKVNTKDLEKTIDASIDEQLSTAASNSTYDSTFKEVMQNQLKDYQKALQAAYQQTSGPKGRALLEDEFNGAQLLLTQLNSPGI